MQNNVSKEHIEAIKTLINLQKQQKVIIKRCDKGAGIIILNFEYINACNAHLNLKIIHNDVSTSKYYIEVNEEALNEAKSKLEGVLQDALVNQIISKDEYEAMHP